MKRHTFALAAATALAAGLGVTVAGTSAQAQTGNCHPAYTSPCVPNDGQDVDCEGGGGNGPHYVKGPVILKQVGTDPFDLDGTPEDGKGCEVPGGGGTPTSSPSTTAAPSTTQTPKPNPTTTVPSKPGAVRATPRFTG